MRVWTEEGGELLGATGWRLEREGRCYGGRQACDCQKRLLGADGGHAGRALTSQQELIRERLRKKVAHAKALRHW